MFGTSTVIFCIDRLDCFHNCAVFEDDDLFPVTLLPVSAGSDIVPETHRCSHIPLSGALGGFRPVLAFCSPHLCTAVIDDRAVPKAGGLF